MIASQVRLNIQNTLIVIITKILLAPCKLSKHLFKISFHLGSSVNFNQFAFLRELVGVWAKRRLTRLSENTTTTRWFVAVIGQLWLRWIGFHQEWMEWWSNKKPSWYPQGAKRRQIKNTFAGQQAQLQRVLCDDEQEEGGVDLRGGFRKPRGYIRHDGLNIVIVMDMVDKLDRTALVLHCFTTSRPK